MRKCVAGNQAACQDCPLTNQKPGCLLRMGLLANRRRGMSLVETRNADQLVVGGGASITSDSDHGPVRWKATTTTTTTNHYPGSWAYLGMAFLLLTFMSCQPVLGIEGDIFPENDIIEVGTNLNITCILRNESGAEMEMPTSRDIVWYKDTDIIPSQDYHIVNDTVSSISIVDAALNDSATYHCALNQDTDVNDYLGSTLQVGYEPQPATSLTCGSNNIYDYYCEWDPVPTHIVNESHTFQFIYKGKWKDCPDLVSPSKCFIYRTEHQGSVQEVRVISSNDLGDDAIKTISFYPEGETIPLPPRNLAVSYRSSTVLLASWDLPAEWESYASWSIQYRLRWASQYNPQNWLGELPCPNRSCEIRQLDPYTEYVVEVAAQEKYNRDNAWGDWSDPVEGRTNEAAPIGTVQNLETSDLNGTSDYDRNVLISWEMVPERQQRGPILGYSVTVTPHSSCLDQLIFNDIVNSTEVIVEDLEKFCSYTVRITAFNSVGSGPVEDEQIQDMTTNPLPPSVVTAETLSYQSVLMTWDKPTPIQGYISHYTVHWIKARGQDDLGQSRQVHPSNLSYRVNDLEGYVLYSFKVSVTNRIGVSGWSTEVQATTDESIPEASPTNVTVEPITNDPNSLLVNWIDVSEDDAHGQIQGHYLYYCHVAEESLSLPLCSLGLSDCLAEKRERKTFSKAIQKPVTLTGVAPFSHYLIWISAFTSVGEGPRSTCPSSGRTSEGTPSQPLNVSVTGSDSTSIGLTWSPPLEKNGIIRNYTILVKSNTSAEQQEFYTGGVQSYLMEGLYGYIHYSLQVRACTTTCGATSDEVYQQTHIGVPEQPGNLNIQPTSHNGVTLRWDPPVHPNGPIDHYLVSYRHAEEPSTPSPVVVRSASSTTTLANSIDEWLKTTELTMKMEVDCSQAPFLFQVVAVNVLEGSPSVGEAAESVLSECIELETTLSPLIWLILPGGAILLFFLLTSLYYVQSKLGKSWPDPVYTDMVKNNKDMKPLPRPRRVEKEEFDTIQIDCPPDLNDVMVAEEYPSQPYHCPMQTSRTDPLTDSINIKSEIGGKQAYLRTVSIDSGVPPSPQDHLDFSSSEDVFDLEDHETITDWMQDTYSFSNPKVSVSHTVLGGKGVYLPKRSVSLSSSDGYGILPAIEENKCMDPIMEKILGDKGTIVVGASTSTQVEWLADDYDDDEDDIDEISYSRISKLSSPLRQPQGTFKDQCASANQKKPDSSVEGYIEDRTEQTISFHDSGEHSMASDSGYVRNDMAYMKFALNEVSQETTFKSEPDDDYVPGPMNYSVLAIPQVEQVEQSLTSNYMSEESLAYTKLGTTPELTGQEIIQSCSSTVASDEQPSSRSCVPTEGIGYVKLGKDSPGEDMPEEQLKSSWNDMPLLSPSDCLSDYVRGVDLHEMLENGCKLSESSGSPTSPIYNQGEMETVEPQDDQHFALDMTKATKSRKQVVRSRTDSSSSSSGYGSDNRGQVSGYVVVSNQPKEQSDNYANLAFASSESETDSDVDVKSEKAVHPEDEHNLCPATCSESKDCNTSYVEYISNDSIGVGFVNDYPRSDPSGDNDSVGFPDSITPCLQTKGRSRRPQGHLHGGCKIMPGYVSHNALLGADMTGNITSEVERLPSPATPHDASKLDIYQVPSRACQELESDRAGHEIADGDDGYVPFGGSDGYVLRVLDGSQAKEEYMPMSPIRKTRIEEDCL